MSRILTGASIRRLSVWTSVCILLSQSAAISAARAGGTEEPLPTDHWAYGVIEELYASGAWGTWTFGTRPWYRGDIARRVAALREEVERDPQRLMRDQRWLLGKLESEFKDDLSAAPAAEMIVTRPGATASLQHRLERFDDPLWRSRLGAYAGLGTGSWWVRLRGGLDSDGDLDPTFFGKKWKSNLTGTIDLGYFSLRHGGFGILLGRDFVRWGPGAHDVLLLNDQSPPFDMARIAYHHERFTFTYFVAGLDRDFAHPDDSAAFTGPGVKRYIAGHRIEVRPHHRLQAGFSEVVVWGGPSRQLEAYYLNPFLPYYWEQINADSDDNVLWSFDLSYRIPSGPMLYGEFLIDDFQIDFESEPHQVGWMLGLNWARPAGVDGGYLTADWSHIEPTVYGQNRPYNRYLNHRVGMGSDLGPDADRWYLRWRQHMARAWDLSGRVERVRRGERTIDTPQDGRVTRDGFPSGTAEQTTTAEIEWLYYPDAHLRAQLRAGYLWQRNTQHLEGHDRHGGFVSLSLSITGWQRGVF